MWIRRCFCSCVKIWGTIFAEIFLIPKSSFTTCRTVSLFIFNSSVITRTPNLRSERTKFRTLSTFESVFAFWLPTSWVVLHIFSPFLEPSVPCKNTRFLHSVLTIATANRAKVSLAHLPTFIKKTWYLSAAPERCHSFFREPYTADNYYFLCCSETNDSFGLWLM
jgi:hypothetical protein